MRPLSVVLVLLTCIAPASAALLQQDLPEGDDPAAIVFRYRSPELDQYLKVNIVSKRKIRFVLRVDETCHKRITGTAINHGHDYEIDADEAGVLYPSNEYIYRESDGHTLYIRIAARTRGFKQDKAYVFETRDRSGCPVSEEMMQRERMGLHLIRPTPRPSSGDE
jgi:hypothetical protein